jgi:hypothetical protein
MRCSTESQITGISIMLLFAVSCTIDEANRYYLNERLPRKNVNDVEVLREAPERPYIVLADLQAEYASIRHMRKRAAAIGADAVIIVLVGGLYSEGEVWAGEDRHSGTYSRIIGTAIKYKTQ